MRVGYNLFDPTSRWNFKTEFKKNFYKLSWWKLILHDTFLLLVD